MLHFRLQWHISHSVTKPCLIMVNEMQIKKKSNISCPQYSSSSRVLGPLLWTLLLKPQDNFDPLHTKPFTVKGGGSGAWHALLIISEWTTIQVSPSFLHITGRNSVLLFLSEMSMLIVRVPIILYPTFYLLKNKNKIKKMASFFH